MPQTLLQRAAPLAWLAAASVASAWALSVMLPAGWADIQTMKTRWQLSQWTTGKAPPPGIVEWGNARNHLAQGLKTTPLDPSLHEGMGWLYASQAIATAALPEVSQPFMRQALLSYQTAARLRPMSGQTWAHIALAHHALNDAAHTADLWASYQKALAYGQREVAVQNILARIAFSRWPTMPPDLQQQFQALLEVWPTHNQAAAIQLAQRLNATPLLPAWGQGAPTNAAR